LRRCPVRDRRVEEQIENLTGGLEIPARPHRGLCRSDFGGELGLLFILVDQVNEGLDEVVVDLPVTMRSKAQQIKACCRNGHSLQLVDGIELDQRGIILHALVGEAGRWQEALTERAQGLKELPALHLLTQLAVAEILRLMLEQADPVHPRICFEQCRQPRLHLRRQRSAEQVGDAQSFVRDGPPHHILKVCVAGRNDALLRQELQHLLKNESRLGR